MVPVVGDRPHRAGRGDPLLDPGPAELPPRRGGDRGTGPRLQPVGDDAPGLDQRVDPASLLPPRLALVASVRRPRGRAALALGAVRDGHGPGRLPRRAGADRAPRRHRRRGDRRRQPDAGLVLPGRPRLRAAGPAQHRRAALLPARPAQRGCATSAGGRRSRRWRWPPTTSPSSRWRSRRSGCWRRCGRCAGCCGRSPASPSPAWRWPRSPCTRRRARTTTGSPASAWPVRLRGDGDHLLRRRSGPAQARAGADRAVRRRGRAAALARRRAGEARRRGGPGDRRRQRPARPRLRRRRPGLRARAQPAAGADPAGAGRRGRDRGAAGRPARDRGRRRAGRLPRSPSASTRTSAPPCSATTGAAWRAIGPPRAPRAILVWEQGDEPLAFYIGRGEHQVKWKQWRLGADPGRRSRRGQRPPAARPAPAAPCRPPSAGCSG